MALGHIISTISVKGGVGKTTTSFLLAQEMLQRGLSVSILDLDPNSPFVRLREFRQTAGRPPLCTILGLQEIGEKGFFDAIDGLSKAHDFTILDCEGSQNYMLTKAASVSGLTIIPLKHSPLDAWSLPTVTSFVKEQSRVMHRPLPYRILVNFTAGGAVVTNWERDILNELDANKIPRFQTLLYEGNAFKDMWGEAATLYEMDADLKSGNARPDAIARSTKAITRMQALCDELFTVMNSSSVSA